MSYVAKVFTVIYDLPLPVAPHVTVVRVGCDTNRSPASCPPPVGALTAGVSFPTSINTSLILR